MLTSTRVDIQGWVLLPRYMSIKSTLIRSVMQQSLYIYIFSTGNKVKKIFSTERVNWQIPWVALEEGGRLTLQTCHCRYQRISVRWSSDFIACCSVKRLTTKLKLELNKKTTLLTAREVPSAVPVKFNGDILLTSICVCAFVDRQGAPCVRSYEWRVVCLLPFINVREMVNDPFVT